MNLKLKNLILPAVLTALYGCGGGNSGTTSGIISGEPSTPPVVDAAVLEAHPYGTITTNDTGAVQWNIVMSENMNSFADPQDASGTVKYTDIDMLAGVTAAPGASLTVKNFEFVWVGPDCSDTLGAAVNFPHICDDILTPLGYEAGQEGLTFLDVEVIRDAQNLPVYDEAIYGFKILATDIRVTPSEFAPVLRTSQIAQLNLKYIVTDGTHDIERFVNIVVQGQDSAPEFIELNRDGSPKLDGEDKIVVAAPVVNTSEKFGVTTLNLFEGIYDQDIYDKEQLADEIGDLAEYYRRGQRYTTERLQVINVAGTASNGMPIPDGFFGVGLYASNSAGEITEYHQPVNPGVYADLLAGGENVTVSISYSVTDGDNETPRTIEFTVLGADIVNAPVIDGDLNIAVNSTDDITNINLLDKAFDHEREPMSVVNFTPAAGSEEAYGISIDDNNIEIDPYAFTNLMPGESQTLSYTYSISDGELTSEERMLEVVITGKSTNLVNLNAGFEEGPGSVWENLSSPQATSGWALQWSPSLDINTLTVQAESAHSGMYGLRSNEGATFLQIAPNAILQKQIVENDVFFMSYFVRNAPAWSGILTMINPNGIYNANAPVDLETISANGAPATEWSERIATFRASDYFDENNLPDIGFTLQPQAGVDIDDFSLIKPRLFVKRLVTLDNFSTGSAEGWSVTGDAILEVTEDANRNPNPSGTEYGLNVTTGANRQTLVLDSNNFPQGKIKKGIRYVVQFDLRTPSFVTGGDAFPIRVSVNEKDGANFSRRLEFAEKSNTQWNTYYVHLDTGSDAHNFDGPANNDLNFNWTDAATELRIDLPANSEIQLDNLIMYPVPKY